MEGEGNPKATIVTQISLGGFDGHVKAKDLVKYLEDEIGLVWRCRLKTSCTPIESHPKFEITNIADIRRVDDYKRVEPHAFVHFASPASVSSTQDAAGRCQLMFQNKCLKVSLGPQNPYTLNQRRRTTTPFKMSDVRLEIGNLVSRDVFFVGWRGPPTGVDFLVDPFDGTCKFCFTKETAFSFKNTTQHAVIKCDFKVEFLVREIFDVKHYNERSCLVILLHLGSAPWVWYRTADDDIDVSVPYDLLDDDDPWIRTTDFTPSGAVGRCNYYRVSIPPRHGGKLKKAIDFLKERRVQEESLKRPLRILEESDFGTPMPDTFFCIQHEEGISFDVMFMLNVLVHKGVFNQHQLSEDIFDLLRKQPTEVNLAALKHLCTYKQPVFDVHRKLKTVQLWLLKNPKLLQHPKQRDDISEIRRLVITPTRAYCLPLEVELSNRVLRKYKDIEDRFLRVTFMDEGMQTINSNALSYYVAPIVREITSNSFPQKTRIFKRVKDILTEGFYLCGRRYSFLAFSSNQLRDRSAWFFAEDGKTSILGIKNWMGKFTNKNIAKCAARMGQCFSSTYATVEVPPEEVDADCPDIERNGYVFSDGIGMISPDLAKEVAEKLKLEMNPPCAYQIRYAGCKGVVATWPRQADGIRLYLRPSMNKFLSDHTTLEVCSWTRFQPGFLNRQIIILLTALQVPEEIFWEMQETMVSKLDKMLVDADVAFEVLTASCANESNIPAIMLSAGFKPQAEPHLRGMLTSIRAAQLWGLREKSRIFVSEGRWLMGCFDELGVLEQGQCFIQVSNPGLENSFLKHGPAFSEIQNNFLVVRGIVAIAKNPCLHPGDVRILEAVDVPGLHHMHDCLVFPQKGDRPHADEASGSDLDGDLYFVTWDQNLIPPSKKSWPPMQYDAAEAKLLNRPVRHEDIIEFFSRNMVNESLGTICNAHVAHADRSDYGALDEDCITLAELAATAVDFPKTGKFVTMPHRLKPKLYPDFMGKEENQSYKSTKILGRLYRRIKDAYDDGLATSSEPSVVATDIPYDEDLEVLGSDEYLLDAWDKKCTYDAQLNGLLRQYKVKKEEEIVTGHIWSMPKYNSRKQGQLKERLKHSYTAMKKEFRLIFENLDTDLDQLSDAQKNELYEKKASAWYQVTYHPKWVKKAVELQELDDGDCTIMLSFAWIAADYLTRVKIRSRKELLDFSKPVNSLMKYLVDRM